MEQDRKPLFPSTANPIIISNTPAKKFLKWARMNSLNKSGPITPCDELAIHISQQLERNETTK